MLAAESQPELASRPLAPTPPRSRWDEFYRRMLPAYWLLIFCLTHFPRLRLTGAIPSEDKLDHALAYAVLAFLLWRFAETFRRPLPLWFAAAALVLLSGYGALDEWLQPFVQRDADVIDWIADTTGAALTIGVLTTFRVLRRRGV